MRADSPILAARARRRTRTRAWPAAGLAAGALGLAALLVGLAFAGSPSELARGTRVAGVEVGGLTPGEALAELERRFQRVADDPAVFAAGGETFRLAANQLGVRPDFRGAVAAAAEAGEGFGPIRGFRRLRARLLGAEVRPRLAVSGSALAFALDRIERRVNAPPQDAALRLRGLRVETVPERAGRRLLRERAREVVVRTLGSLRRP
ncbi:MAG TPA: peptidoglycan binding domain-containing protein, partial [Gaiellaceae bacterium]|nr:peptidoglycan binding domain-containing protein [Gaiellaceae bacterium]